MIDSFHIYEDIISKDKQNILEEYFLNKIIRWDTINNTPYIESYNRQKVLSSEKIKDDYIKSIILEIEKNVSLKINKSIHTNYRYKVNLLKSEDYEKSKNIKETIHIDRYEPHISMIYYINDSDGDTKFYKLNDGNILECMKYIQKEEYNRFTQIKSISPKKGKVVVFDGLIPHQSTYPKKGNRYVINFNTVIKTKATSLL
jgi:hypothetical protein